MALFIKQTDPRTLLPTVSARPWQHTAAKILLAALLLCAAAVVAFNYQAAADRARAMRWPMPGQLISTGAGRLHMHCSGHGNPVMLLEADMGGWSQDWALIQAPLARGGRVCSYDRAGSGWSDDVPGRRNGQSMVAALRTALANGAIAPPYILVGHGMGGLLVSLYARSYPADVAGLALLDAISPTYADQFAPGDYATIQALTTSRLRFAGVLAPFGIPQTLGQPANLIAARLPPTERDSALDLARMLRQYHTLAREHDAFDGVLDEVRHAGPLPTAPTLVLAGSVMRDYPVGLDDAMRAVWHRSQDSIAAEAGVPLIELPDTGHYLQIERPDAVIAALANLRATVVGPAAPFRSGSIDALYLAPASPR